MRYLCQLVLFAALLIGCGEQKRSLPNAVGGEGEVLVVMERRHWEGHAGAAVREVLERPIAGLPQREPHFKVAYSAPEGFGDLLVAHHNVLHAEIGPQVEQKGIVQRKDLHALGQLFVQIKAGTPGEWEELFHENGDALVQIFDRHHRERIMRRLEKTANAGLVDEVEGSHAVRLTIPAGYNIKRSANDFIWLQRDQVKKGQGLEHHVIEGILIYHYPYTSDSTFNVQNLVNVRDSVTRIHVEGPAEGSYMIVQRGFEGIDLMPESRAIEIDGRFAYVMRGLFGMHGAKMGGPFISLTTVDEQRGRIVTVEGFAYAPQFDKRELIKELEAIVLSLKISGEGS